VEESVEYRLPGVHQTMTRPDLGLTLPAALRAVLKQDPDTVMISDITAGDTAPVALEAARRGVFILGGLRARNAADALDILVSEGGAGAGLVAGQVQLVVAQRVLRRLARDAKARTLTREEGQILEGKVRFPKVLAALKAERAVHEHTAWKDVVFYTANGAEAYSGLVGIQEVLLPGLGRQEEPLTLLEDALFKAVQGQVSIEEVIEMAAE
jgi:general secretion pathway protein E